jgi:ribonucleoside-diphosphate reductase alpha chain
MSKGLRITRRFTEAGKDPYEKIEWSRRDSRITNPDGSVVFEMTDAEIPAGWSQVASDIMVSKYFRKAGVPQHDDEGKAVLDENGEPVLGAERSAKQVFDRLAGTWRHWGEKEGYFASADDATAFEDEIKYMLANQMAAPNSPQWFNTGLNWAYGLTGPAQGFWYVDGKDGELKASPDSYSRPAPHACFILSVRDDLVNPGGIMDLWVREARIFKFGSGAGSNFSQIRGENERLSGGGKSSGVMSFLKIGDRAAGAIKSGGTTRRAAKMVILDVDHPDIEKFIDWKKIEEEKARVLINHGGFPADFNGDAYATVSGQNSNNSVRVTNEFVQKVLDDGEWDLVNRTDGKVRKTVKARDLWDRIAEAAWACADPGLQFDTTINEWHTSPGGGRIYGSNPCSEFVYLNDTACNLASINLVPFHDDETGLFDIEAYQHAIRVWTIVLEISVAMAHFPSPEIAQGSHDYRPLGLGYANLGSLLMRQGIAYDSNEGRAMSGALTAILTGYSYATSAEIAGVVGPFPRYAENREAMLRVMRNHRRAAHGESDYEDVSHKVIAIDPDLCPADFLVAARSSWDLALELGEKNGYRNGQASVIAPTGTIGLLMDCDTTGVEPDFALVKFKKLAGGGYFKIANQSVAPALRHLGYAEAQIKEVVEYIVGTSSVDGAPHINRETLTAKGFDDEDLDKLEKALPAVFELRHAFNVFTFGEQTLQRLGFGVDEYTGWDFNLLKALGFTSKEINEANDHICGRQTIEGAPHVKEEHLAVFDTANKNGKYGERFIHHNGHIKMMAAAQPFISGAISKCVTGETLLTTADGLIRIGSLRQDEEPDSFRDEIIEVASRGGTRKTDAFYYGGARSVRRVTLRSGHRVTGTPNHRLLVAGSSGLEWRALADIQPDEYVALQYGTDMWSAIPARFDDFKPSKPYGNQKEVSIPDEMSEDLAFLLGAIVAEGHMRSNWTIHVTNADEGVLQRVSSIAQRIFGVEAPIRRQEDRCPGVQVSSKTIVEFVDYLGVGRGAHNKRIPDAVLRSPRRMILAFLSGLFLDGYVTLSGMAKMGITTASGPLMDDLQAVLTNLGVVHGRTSKYVVETDSVYHEVYAAGREAKQLARLVPFAEAGKAARALELLRRSFSQSTADVVPGITGRQLYELMPLDRLGEDGRSERLRFTYLLDPRTTHVSRRTLEKVAMVPGVELPEWLCEVLADRLHFSPVTEVIDDGEREVFDLSVPETHAFLGNGIVNHNTINMPNEVTVEEIEEAYRMSWELGLKAMALYRDGSKAAQPLNSTSDEGEHNDDEASAITAAVDAEKAIHWGNLPAGISPTEAYAQGMKPPRFLLPARRNGFNQEARIGGHKVYLRTGEYEDGTLGEIFIDLAKEGATLKGILSCFAIAVSKGLQYGVPLDEFVDTFTFQTFEPRGLVEGHPNIKMANSIVDYVFRALGVEYLQRDELAQVPPVREMELPGPAKGLATEVGIQLDLTDAAAEADVDAVKAAVAFVDAPISPPRSEATLGGEAQRAEGGIAVQVTETIQVEEKVTVVAGSAAMVDSALKENMGDAPVCSNCGHMTIRNGSCYVCLTCGDTTGCS